MHISVPDYGQHSEWVGNYLSIPCKLIARNKNDIFISNAMHNVDTISTLK